MSTEVNTALGTWSELFMLLAALVYLCVFICFAWDMASHSKAMGEAEKRTATRSTSAAASSWAPPAGRRPPPRRSTRRPTSAMSATTPGRAAAPAAVGAPPRSSRGRSPTPAWATGPRAPSGARAAIVLMVMAFAIHVVAVVTRSIAAQRVPWGNMYEFSTTSALIIAGIYLIMLIRRDLRFVGVMISGLVTLLLTMATIAHPTPVSPLQPVLQSYWLIIHVSIAVASSAIFAVTFAMSVLQLIQDRRERRILAGGDPGWAFMRSVPSAKTLENFAYRLNSVGFVFWTFTLAAGAIWARDSWGRYWGWDPKEVWTFVIWVVYAAYLHARATRGWTGTRSAWLSIAGFLCVLFNYFIVNTLFEGLHSYSGAVSRLPAPAAS